MDDTRYDDNYIRYKKRCDDNYRIDDDDDDDDNNNI
jgi:hypothetical protein